MVVSRWSARSLPSEYWYRPKPCQRLIRVSGREGILGQLLQIRQ
jgi:hypothetical protein